MDNIEILGRVVISKSGRDKGKRFVVIGVFDEDLVLICDGKLRKIEKPKKKKLKHLVFTDICLDDVREDLSHGRSLVDKHVKQAIRDIDSRVKEAMK